MDKGGVWAILPFCGTVEIINAWNIAFQLKDQRNTIQEDKPVLAMQVIQTFKKRKTKLYEISLTTQFCFVNSSPMLKSILSIWALNGIFWSSAVRLKLLKYI